MEKGKSFLSFIGGVVSVFGGIVSIVLTINLAIQIFGLTGSHAIWTIIGAIVGIVFNLAEIGFFIRYVINQDYSSLILGCIFAFISVSASIGSLQVSLERGSVQSVVFQEKLSEIQLLKQQVESLNKTARQQQRINHVTRSQQTLKQANTSLLALNKAEQELDELKKQGAGINSALYKAYAKLLNIEDVNFVAIVLNLIFCSLLEFCFVYYTIQEFKKEDAKSSNIATETPESKRFGLVKKTGTENRKIGFKVGSTVPPIQGKKNVPEIGNGNDSGNDKTVNVNVFGTKKPFQDNGVSNENLKRIAKRFKGKSDEFILLVWDNWNQISNQKKSYQKVSNLVGDYLPGTKNRVSKTYVWRVIQRERKGGQA